MQDLEHLALIWAGVLASYYLARRTRLTPVLFFLAVGALYVNTGLLPVESSSFIRGFAEIGIILIMFALGFEEDSSHFVKGIKRSWGIALFGAIAPFLAAFFVSQYFWDNTSLALMCGLAMTATAVSLTMVSLQSEHLHKTAAATGIMTSAILDDIGSLALVAILVPMATGQADISLNGILIILMKAILFFILVVLLERWVLPCPVTAPFFRNIPIIRDLGIWHLISVSDGEKATLTILLMALLISMLAYYFGFHPAVGAYMAGLILKEEYFHLRDEFKTSFYQQTKRIIDDVAYSWIGPIFFVELGSKLIFDASIFISVIPETLSLTLALLIVQTGSAALAARYTGQYPWHESLMIGFGMLGRAELAFVVMDIGYVQYDIFSDEAFYTLMFTAFWLNVAVPLTIKWWKPFYAGDKQFLLVLGKYRLLLSKPPEKT